MTKTRGYIKEIQDHNCGKCGGEALRLHATAFRLSSQRVTKLHYYVACDHCGETTGWMDTPKAAMEAYPKLAPKRRAKRARRLLAA